MVDLDKLKEALETFKAGTMLKSAVAGLELYKAISAMVAPEVDWPKVPMGSLVVHVTEGTGQFIRMTAGRSDSLWIKTDEGKGAHWDIFNCRLSLDLRTVLMKHTWPVDMKRPHWLNPESLVVSGSANKFSMTYRAKDVDWENYRDWFIILEDEVDE